LEEKLQTRDARPEEKESAAAALDRALEEAAEETDDGGRSPDLWSRRAGGTNLRLIDVSMDILTAAGTSTADDDELENLQGGEHDPNQRGFTLQQGELSLLAAVDPYVSAETHVIFTTDNIELEEAFFTTQSLPYGLQLEGGHFFTEFGRINPTHPHAWDWMDQPVINSRLFGGDGNRSPGFRLGWLTPVPWFSEVHFGMQNADEGGFTPSFMGRSVGGRPTVDRGVESLEDLLYLMRWNNSWEVSDTVTALVGASGLYGPNNSGPDGETWIYGADFKFRWRPVENFRGWPFVVWQTEVMKRDYHADSFVAVHEEDVAPLGTTFGTALSRRDSEDDDEEAGDFPNDLRSAILRDAGFYTQVLYGFRYSWAAGLRYEFASGSGDSVEDGELASRQNDPFRDDRHRVSPLLVWQPSEYSRFRLQYNYDNAEHLKDDDAHSVWLGAEVLYGAHPAHTF
jgi:hypothetical protein